MDCSMPGFPVLHYLPELTEIHVRWVSDFIGATVKSVGLAIKYTCLEFKSYKLGSLFKNIWNALCYGTPLQYSCLENSMDRGAWGATVHGVAKSRTRLSDFTFTFHCMHWRRKWQPTPEFLPGEAQGRGSLVGCRLWGRTELDTTEATY